VEKVRPILFCSGCTELRNIVVAGVGGVECEETLGCCAPLLALAVPTGEAGVSVEGVVWVSCGG